MYLKEYFKQLGKDILIRFPKRLAHLVSFQREMTKFRQQNDGRFDVRWQDVYPCLKDRLETTPFDQHYIYHPAWAARVLAQTRPAFHTDFSSKLSFCTIVSAFVPVKFYDYRPADLQLSGLESGWGDLTNISLPDNSQPSVSCMHTIEHIGLGRYGDPIDPQGDIKAIAELKRIVQRGGDLLFVTPIGRSRIEFNAHRIYSYKQVTDLFAPFHLQEFSLIPDQGGLITNADPLIADRQEYGCGCFWFKKL
jgi:hypothetical protein